MSLDVVDLRHFYSNRLGVVARRFISRGIRGMWKSAAGERMLGIGYATPYLGIFREDAERCLAFMPASQGVVKWPSNRPGARGSGRRTELPLTDSAVDRVLLVHALEMADDPVRLLREVWRVLSANGHAACGGAKSPRPVGAHGHDAVRPRPALFALADHPQFLRETMFTPKGWGEALFVPPVQRGWFLRSAGVWERLGPTLLSPFPGVHIVEATKQAYRAIPVRREEIGIARNERLRIAEPEGGLFAALRRGVFFFALFFVGAVAHVVAGDGFLTLLAILLRLILALLFLCRGDQAEIVLGMLVVILGANRIAGSLRIARELNVLFCNVGGRTADLDVRSVRLEHAGEGVVAFTVVIVVVIIVVVATTHTLVLILNISHGLQFIHP
jgi:SAM-dependent methyltransferase